jgi:hypothetical protein
MKIIAHRGLWDNIADQNTISSFKRAIGLGCGIETDIRSLNENLVISHSLVSKSIISFDSVLKEIARDLITKKIPLCINIKEDGLIEMVAKSLVPYPELDYSVFDASIPELYKYAQNGIPYLCRISEYEEANKLLHDCSGIWLDSLASNWITFDKLSEINSYKKRIFIVSPELHGREHQDLWNLLQKIEWKVDQYLCTDNVSKALESFKNLE